MNQFMVGANGDDLVILAFGRKLTRDQALNLAAWLVALADPAAIALSDGSGKSDFAKALAEALES